MKSKILLLLLAFLITGCGTYDSANTVEEYGTSAYENVANDSYAKSPLVDMDLGEDSIGTTTETMIVKKGYVDINNDSHEPFHKDLKSLVLKFDGFIASENINKNSDDTVFANYSIKIPNENFENFMKEIEDIGNVLGTSITNEDVTSDYINTTSYIEIKKVEEERLLKIREQATEVESIIDLEEKIARVRTEIAVKTELANSLAAQVKYSEINVSYQDVKPMKINGLDQDFFEQLKRAFLSPLAGLQYLLIFLAYIALPTLLIIVFVAIIYLVIKKQSKKSNVVTPKS